MADPLSPASRILVVASELSTALNLIDSALYLLYSLVKSLMLGFYRDCQRFLLNSQQQVRHNR